MSSTIFVTLARQQALRDEIDVISNNIANASTTAFKGERPIFKEQLLDAGTGEPISYVVAAGTERNFTQGRIERTGNDLDVAISGEGYFVVEDADGEAYTRQGHFELDGKGKIVTSSGAVLLNENGEPIIVGNRATHIAIGRDGTIATNQGALGRVKLVDIDNEEQLVPRGEGLFAYAGQDLPPVLKVENTHVEQGALEASNVNPILEMTRMIEVVRSYQSAQRMMDTDNELLRKAIQDITALK